MASVALDLEDLVPDLVVELNIPGEDAYPTVSNDEWVGYLRNAFWAAVMDGLLQGYRESDGIIRPESSNGEIIGRDLQQIIILYAAIAITRSRLLNLRSVFRVKGGNSEYEVQQSAQLLRALLDELTSRREHVISRLSDGVINRNTFMFDGFSARQRALNEGFTSWVGS